MNRHPTTTFLLMSMTARVSLTTTAGIALLTSMATGPLQLETSSCSWAPLDWTVNNAAAQQRLTTGVPLFFRTGGMPIEFLRLPLKEGTSWMLCSRMWRELFEEWARAIGPSRAMHTLYVT